MSKLIFIASLLSFGVYANNVKQTQEVQVQSRTIQFNKVSIKNNMAQRQIPAPTKNQTTLTKNSDGTFSYQCKQKHNHKLHREMK